MCGISGLFNKEISDKSKKKRIRNMVKSLNHRGPDFSNILNINLGYFGHNRLKILDLSSNSNQPMVSNSGNLTIVFNGEIYNFNEIKKKLKNKYEFKTKGDTEVILASIETYGVEWFLKNANGMFGIGVYNKIKNKLYLIRDRLGIKPLYYYCDSKSFIFGSEVKSILNSGLVESILNENSLDMYLAYRDTLEPETFFKNIYQVKSGCYLIIDISTFKHKEINYWELPNIPILHNRDEKKLIMDLEKQLIKSIKYRMISDVSFGSYLSGGVDSSLIVAISSLISKKKIKTYTIGFNEKEFNEFKYSEIIAQRYNTEHYKIIQNKNEYLNLIKELIRFRDSPLGVPNEVSLAVMSKKLKDKITVVLSGEGADELFGGYGKIFRLPVFYEYKLKYKNKLSYFKEFMNNYEYTNRKIRDKYIKLDINKRNFFDKKIRKKIFNNNSNFNSTQKFFHKIHIKSLLRRLDMTTMYASVEGRVPFLDHNLVEFVYKNVPEKFKIKWRDNVNKREIYHKNPKEYSEILDTPKYLLKKLSEKYLPKEIVYRKKVGFPVPLADWEEEIEKLAKRYLKSSMWLKNNNINDLIKDLKKYKIKNQILWMFINIELFYREYFKKNWKY